MMSMLSQDKQLYNSVHVDTIARANAARFTNPRGCGKSFTLAGVVSTPKDHTSSPSYDLKDETDSVLMWAEKGKESPGSGKKVQITASMV